MTGTSIKKSDVNRLQITQGKGKFSKEKALEIAQYIAEGMPDCKAAVMADIHPVTLCRWKAQNEEFKNLCENAWEMHLIAYAHQTQQIPIIATDLLFKRLTQGKLTNSELMKLTGHDKSGETNLTLGIQNTTQRTIKFISTDDTKIQEREAAIEAEYRASLGTETQTSDRDKSDRDTTVPVASEINPTSSDNDSSTGQPE